MQVITFVKDALAVYQRAPRLVREFIPLAVLSAISWLDFVTPAYISVAGLYFLPISLAIWYCSRTTAAIVVGVSVAMNLFMTAIEIPATAPAWHDGLAYISTLIAFLLFVLLMHYLRWSFGQLEEENRIDALTGLRCRRNFLETAQYEFSRAIRSGEVFTVALIDLDNFKAINDTHGHAAGDALLVEVGRCLAGGLRTVDVVGRLGGDEFAALLPGTDAAEAGTILQRVHAVLRTALRAADDRVSASIGAVVVDPAAELTLADALKKADAVMYSVKNGPKDRVVVERG